MVQAYRDKFFGGFLYKAGEYTVYRAGHNLWRVSLNGRVLRTFDRFHPAILFMVKEYDLYSRK